jgi:hypothetical protein
VVVQEDLLLVLVPLLQLHYLLLQSLHLRHLIHDEQLEYLLQFVVGCIGVQLLTLFLIELALEALYECHSDIDDASHLLIDPLQKFIHGAYHDLLPNLILEGHCLQQLLYEVLGELLNLLNTLSEELHSVDVPRVSITLQGGIDKLHGVLQLLT